MATAAIPVDLFNPGQVFACVGLVELAERLLGYTEAAFDWSDSGGDRFVVRVDGEDDPIAVGLEFLAEADVEALVPPGSDLSTERWKVSSAMVGIDDPYPAPPPPTPASLPAGLRAREKQVVLSSWAEIDRGALGTGRDNVKFWAGAAGYPGVALLRDALDAVRSSIGDAQMDPFSVSSPQSSSFRFDWRRDYIPIQIGFSLNPHGKAMQPRGYPLVEVLAAIGMSHARPCLLSKLEYRYGVIGLSPADELVPSAILRAALGAAALPFSIRTFVMNLDWPSQEGQARCITTVYEET